MPGTIPEAGVREYTGQYMPASGDFKWATHINSFKLGSCQ